MDQDTKLLALSVGLLCFYISTKRAEAKKLLTKDVVVDRKKVDVTPISSEEIQQKEIEEKEIKKEKKIEEQKEKIIEEEEEKEIQKEKKVVEEKEKEEETSEIKHNTFYAEFRQPFYSIIDRSITEDLYNKLISIGLIPREVDLLLDLKNIALEDLPPTEYIRITADALIKYFTGFGPGVFFAVITYVHDLIFGESAPMKTPEEIIKETATKAVNFYKAYVVDKKNGLLLGFLAQNRVNSCMIPIVKFHNKKTKNTIYATIEMANILIAAEYKTVGKIEGFVSNRPFEHSCEIKILYNILLADFVNVVSGSEYERLLSLYDYVPITSIGYISTKIQPGFQGDYLTGEGYQSIKKDLLSDPTEVLNIAQNVRKLSNKVKLPSAGSRLVPHNLIPGPRYDPYEQIKNVRPYKGGSEYLFNSEYAKFRVPGGEKYNYYFEKTSEIPKIGPNLLGIKLPKLGGVSGVVYNYAVENYTLQGKNVIIPAKSKRMLVHQVDGSLLEIVLTESGYNDINFVTNFLEMLAVKGKDYARAVIGHRLRYDNNRFYYLITSHKNFVFYDYRTMDNNWFKYKR